MIREFGSPYSSLKRKFNTWCRYTHRIDTYGCGCEFDCKYCYAKSLLTFRNNWKPSNPLAANINDIEAVISMLPGHVVIRLGGMVDCFQPLESRLGVTFNTIKLLNKYKINYLIVTKSDMVADSKYLSIYDNKLAHFQVSITTTSDQKCTYYERAPITSKRILAIESLSKQGLDVSVRLSPIMYQWVDFDLLNRIKCNKILIEFLKVNHWIKKTFNIDYSEYNHRWGGFDHLPLEKKVCIVEKVTGFEKISVGEYVKEHYEYFRDNVNYNKMDCCNLDVRWLRQDAKQLNVFSEDEDEA